MRPAEQTPGRRKGRLSVRGPNPVEGGRLMRRILVAIPVSSDEWDPVILRLCQAVANHSTQLAVAHLERGVTELESSLDEALVTEPLLQLLSERADTFDGVIVDCYIDP